ncbi:group III truncated hemoglobin [Roseateles sp. BYS180W]|uniref:Group III truncated hemoglobin n=1 Tax=Roseateles rivi TaxID=3299028 RepID=A0ABW7FRQ6_9BURK
MTRAGLCTEEDIEQLVTHFYAAVRQDAVLGPIFNRHIDDWPSHLSKLVDFWSSILRGTARFRGAPMPAHQALPELQPELFQRWLRLFAQSCAAHTNAAMSARAMEVAPRIAQSLWLGWQQCHRAGLPEIPLMPMEAL